MALSFTHSWVSAEIGLGSPILPLIRALSLLYFSDLTGTGVVNEA